MRLATVIIEPSVAWNGTAGSGFGGAQGVVPADPLRTTAKPALRLIVPPKQYFTDLQLVGVAAMANNGGSMLDNLGLEKVILHYEGNVVDIARPTFQSFLDANGNTVTYLGWWAWLKHNGTNGHARVYFEAVPADATMQHRVIGPYQFSPQPTVHDYSVTVTPSSPQVTDVNYQTLDAAMIRIKSLGKQNALITVTESNSGLAGGKYVIGDNGVSAWTFNGYCTIQATVPIVIGKTGYTTDAAAIQYVQRLPLRLRGENVAFDFRHVTELNAGGASCWLDGCTVYCSGDGRNERFRGIMANISGYTIRGNAWLTETVIHDMNHACHVVNLARGVKLTDIGGDIFTDARCVIGCTVEDHSNDFWNTELPMFTVIYNGAEATATLSRSNGAVPAACTFTATWGTNTATFVTGRQETNYTGAVGNGYWPQDVVNWLNSLPGWSAVVQDNTMVAVAASMPGQRGQGFGGGGNVYPAISVKGVTVQVIGYYDMHGDFYQQTSTNEMEENVIVAFNRGWNMEVQGIFLSPVYVSPRTSVKTFDFMVIGNSLHFRNATSGEWSPDVYYSQIGRTNNNQSHLVLAHNSLAQQAMWLRTDNTGCQFDSYCLIANNALRDIVWKGAVDADLVNARNVLSASAIGTPGTGGAKEGSFQSWFADAEAGDFSPAGELLANLKAPVVRYDANGLARGAMAPVGAMA